MTIYQKTALIACSIKRKQSKELEGRMKWLQRISVSFFLVTLCLAQDINLVIYHQDQQQEISLPLESVFKSIETKTGITISRSYKAYDYDESDEVFQTNFCSMIDVNSTNIVLDLVWSKANRIHLVSNKNQYLYFKLDATIYPFIEVVVEYLKKRSAKDSVFIVNSETELDQALYALIEKANLRILVLNQLPSKSAKKLAKMRPIPSYYSAIATTENMNTIFESAIKAGLLHLPERWNLFFLDPMQEDFQFKGYDDVTRIVIDPTFPCQWIGSESRNAKNCEWPKGFDHKSLFLEEVVSKMVEVFKDSSPSNLDTSCQQFDINSTLDRIPTLEMESKFFDNIDQSGVLSKGADNEIKFQIKADIFRSVNQDQNEEPQLIGNFTTSTGIESSIELAPVKRYLRVGTAFALPWSYYKTDSITGETLIDEEGNPIWEGYCIEFIEKLAEMMDFKYDIIEPKSKTVGENIGNGRWDGLVGDLMTGDTDIVVAAMKMTAEREEVIDFVAPYFEQTGITIVIRNPVRVTSLFKFMTVLRLEVWLSVVAALVSTAIMIWLLDKYSPYSAQNNKEEYPYPCREFTLKESFWFALTSFTPQGGGEAPKALSGRALVAAYWLFVVLMLATFTANLAAFLTVERMQTPIQSLEQLAKQSRINYTVVEGSETHQYFINMKFAEDTLYRVWKEITLNSTTDQAKYRVWDYPIREQYGQILLAINSSNPVKNAAEGFREVDEHLNADFAFIHDSAEIKYEMTKNCNLTEVGEVFAEQPYALAVQQGSRIIDELSKSILGMQKDRFFELLSNKYWNQTLREECSNTEGEGISLESLGGVFIATLFGLGLAMVTLVFEVIYYKRKNSRESKDNQIIQVKPKDLKDKLTKPKFWQRGKKVTIGDGDFKIQNQAGITKRATAYDHKFGDYIE